MIVVGGPGSSVPVGYLQASEAMMRHYYTQFRLVLICILLAPVVPAVAQGEAVPAVTPAPVATGVPLPRTLADHPLAPRDVVHVLCWTSTEIVVNAGAAVDPAGVLNLPQVGALHVQGMRVGTLQTNLVRAYGQQYPGCTVHVMVEGLLGEGLTALKGPASLPANLAQPLAPGDMLRLRAWTGDTTHLEVTVTLGDNLTLALPPLGAVPVRDLTLQSLQSDLLRRYRQYYPQTALEVLLAGRHGQPLDLRQPPAPIAELPAHQKFPPEVSASEILRSLPRFGLSVFGGESARPGWPTPLPPPGNLPVPADYLLGPGDQLAIRAWSGPLEHYGGEVPVSTEGRIYLPLLGELSVSGQTLAQLNSLITQRFSRLYRDAQVSVTLAQLRTVDVYVAGDVAQPGKYTLPGTTTVLGALYAAGGPSEIGSLRDLRLSRKGAATRTIDLYGYLLTGEREGDEPLQPGDTVFVGPQQATVGIAGLVRRPGLYEIKAGLNVAEALGLAAGLDPRGYAPNVEVWRVDNNTDWHVINLSLAGQPEDPRGRGFKLQGGDLLLVRPVLERTANTVEITGAVRRPGAYEVGSGLDVASLLQRAQGLEDTAYVQAAAIWRLTPTNDYRLLRFNLLKASQGEAADNLKLQPGDRVQIYSRYEVLQPQEVTVQGAVGSPGVYPWAEDLRLSDLLLLARGLLPEAYVPRAELHRLTPDRRREVIPVSLSRLLAGEQTADPTLRPGDQVQIYTRREVAVASEIVISGFVQRPGVYERREGMRVSDLIYAAGGLLPNAGAVVEYTAGRTAGPAQISRLQLQREGERLVITPDQVLADDDHVTITGSGELHVRPELATVEGLVNRPGTYALLGDEQQPDTVYQLLQRAGGLLPTANPRGLVLYRTKDALLNTGQVDDVNQVLRAFNREGAGAEASLSSPQKSSAMAASLGRELGAIMGDSGGDAIVVIPPRSLSYDSWANAVPIEGDRLLATEGREGDMPLRAGDVVVVPPLPTTVAVIGAVVRPGAVKFQGALPPLEYVNLAGGAATDAVLARTVVIRANGAAVALAKARTVQAGDVIVVPSDYMVRQVSGKSSTQKVLQSLATLAAGYLLFAK